MGVAILDAGLVCRITGKTRRSRLFDDPRGLARIVASDLAQLTNAGRVPTQGDTRCITFGHLTRMAIRRLRQGRDPERPMPEKLAAFAETVAGLADVDEVPGLLAEK